MLSGEFLLPQMEQFKSLRVFFMNVGVWPTDWVYVFGDADTVPVCCAKDRAECESRSILIPALNTWSQALDSVQWDWILASELRLFRRIVGFSLRDRMGQDVTWNRATINQHWKHQVQESDQDPSWVPLRWGVLGLFHQEEAQTRPRTHWRSYIPWLAWERNGVSLEELEEMPGEKQKGGLGTCAYITAPTTPVSSRKLTVRWVRPKDH